MQHSSLHPSQEKNNRKDIQIGISTIKDDLSFLRDGDLSDELKKLVFEKTHEIRLETIKRRSNDRKWLHSTPLAVALAGLVTIGGNFLFDYMKNEQKQGIDQQREQSLANSKAIDSAREFQFKIVERELTQDKTEAQRAQVLLFLVRAGVLSGLNEKELRNMAEAALRKDGQEPGKLGIPSFGFFGPRELTPDYLGAFQEFLSSIGVKNIKAEQLLVLGASSESRKYSAHSFNTYPPRELWVNITKTVQVLDQFVERYGAKIEIISTFRAPQYNSAIGGARESNHTKFNAIDFRVVGKGTPKEWADHLLKMRDEGIFIGGVGISGGIVHLDTRESNATWIGD